ncbi:MAG: FKBP-type peptidyl-prolyl cis-trans isomerase [Burkholderiales bacterium]
MIAVGRNAVVSLAVELCDAQGALIHATQEPLVYLHGGYGGLLETLERALEGKLPGDSVRVHLEPEQAYGDYDAALLRVEPCSRYGDGLEVGMQVEDAFEGGTPRRYTVTDLADDKVVLDGNHPLAGIALSFACRVIAVRAASESEIRAGRIQA